jgi:DNA-binding CsgD family transcriptional regulator
VLHGQLCEVALRAGDAFEAARMVEERDQWTALEPEASLFRTRMEALLASLRGEPQRAAQLAATVFETSEANPGLDWHRLEALRATGLGAVFERDLDEACASFGRVWDHTVREGVDDPGAFPVAGDFVEALAEAGQLDAAGNVVTRLQRLAREQRHPWGLATSRRSAAVVELVDGYNDGAAASLVAAAAGYRGLGLGFEHARALLFLGRVQRRFKKRSAARESLGRAAAVFEQLGCVGWAEQARSELARVSGRRPAHDGGLSPSEQAVAELVASGLSNKEVAARLFVSVYTVEAHLSSVYAKLGIRSRTQLAARLTDPQ